MEKAAEFGGGGGKKALRRRGSEETIEQMPVAEWASCRSTAQHRFLLAWKQRRVAGSQHKLRQKQ